MGLLSRWAMLPCCIALGAGCVSAVAPCEPAATAVCFCDGGYPGNQACSADGDWTECYCPFTGSDDTDVQTEPLAGEPNYVSYCSPCHGVQGLGTGDGIDLTARVPTLTDEQIATAIREGRGRMPAFRSFGDQQVADLVAYLRIRFGQ